MQQIIMYAVPGILEFLSLEFLSLEFLSPEFFCPRNFMLSPEFPAVPGISRINTNVGSLPEHGDSDFFGIFSILIFVL